MTREMNQTKYALSNTLQERVVRLKAKRAEC